MGKDMYTVWVHCYRRGTHIRTYDFGVPIPLDASAYTPPAREQLEADAKTQLTDEGLAAPPYDGITFRIESDR